MRKDIPLCVWNGAARTQRASRLRRRDSDSEGERERRYAEERLLPQLTAGRRVSWRRRELEPGDHDAVLLVWSGAFSSHVLADECRFPRRWLRTAVVSGRAWQRGLMLVLAGASPRFRRMTPDTAQQRGALACRQCQHDGNDSCSKHVSARRR